MIARDGSGWPVKASMWRQRPGCSVIHGFLPPLPSLYGSVRLL